MFRKNNRHLQPVLISNVNDFPEKHRKRLESSWAGVFYRETFCRLDERPFGVLYADFPSRPNIPVNVLVGLESLKADFGWSDEELYDAFTYDMQVRYALGYHQLGEGDFDLRSLYYFRERVSRYMQEKGINLIEKAFEQVTDQQIKAYQLKTGKQRMDSTQIASNIREMSRLQLLVEVLQRVHRMLKEEDQKHYAEVFAPFMEGHAGQYVYHLNPQKRGSEASGTGYGRAFTEDRRTDPAPAVWAGVQRLLAELQPNYAQEPVYQMLERVFGEHFRVEEKVVKTKVAKELSASSLQSPDDLEATYREKGNKSYKGYAANLTETCDPENDLQLITKAQVAPNCVDDAKLMEEALPNLKERTELETLYTDGGYGSPSADHTLRDNRVEQIQTAIRGRIPSIEKLNLADFEIKQTETGKPTQITCPQAQTVAVHPSSQKKGYVTHFDLAICQACPFYQKGCPARPGKQDPRLRLNFSEQQANVSQRRRRSMARQRKSRADEGSLSNNGAGKEGRNLRAAIEATVREIKHPFPASKLPVRGRFRVACMVIGSAIATNARRIQRYLITKPKLENEQKKAPKGQECSLDPHCVSFFGPFKAVFEAGLTLLGLRKLCLSC